MTELVLTVATCLFPLSVILMGAAWRDGNAWTCSRCEYDLRGIVGTSACCPECGERIQEGSALSNGQLHVRPVQMEIGIVLAVVSAGSVGIVLVLAFVGGPY